MFGDFMGAQVADQRRRTSWNVWGAGDPVALRGAVPVIAGLKIPALQPAGDGFLNPTALHRLRVHLERITVAVQPGGGTIGGAGTPRAHALSRRWWFAQLHHAHTHRWWFSSMPPPSACCGSSLGGCSQSAASSAGTGSHVGLTGRSVSVPQADASRIKATAGKVRMRLHIGFSLFNGGSGAGPDVGISSDRRAGLVIALRGVGGLVFCLLMLAAQLRRGMLAFADVVPEAVAAAE